MESICTECPVHVTFREGEGRATSQIMEVIEKEHLGRWTLIWSSIRFPSKHCFHPSLHSSCFHFLLAKREKRKPSRIRTRAWGEKERKDPFAPCARAYPAWLKGNGNDCYAGFGESLIINNVRSVVLATSFPGSLLFPSLLLQGTGRRETLGTRLWSRSCVQLS